MPSVVTNQIFAPSGGPVITGTHEVMFESRQNDLLDTIALRMHCIRCGREVVMKFAKYRLYYDNSDEIAKSITRRWAQFACRSEVTANMAEWLTYMLRNGPKDWVYLFRRAEHEGMDAALLAEVARKMELVRIGGGLRLPEEHPWFDLELQFGMGRPDL